MSEIIIFTSPANPSPTRLPIDIQPNGRLLASGRYYMLNKNVGIAEDELAKANGGGKFDHLPEETFIKLGLNPGGILAEREDDYHARKNAEEAAIITAPNVCSRRIDGQFALCLELDARECINQTLHGVSLTLGDLISESTDRCGRKLRLHAVASWVVIDPTSADAPDNYIYWRGRFNILASDGDADFHRKWERQDYSPTRKGQEVCLTDIVAGLESPLNQYMAECKVDVRNKDKGGIFRFHGEYAARVIAAWDAGERDLDKLKAIFDAVKKDPDYADLVLGM